MITDEDDDEEFQNPKTEKEKKEYYRRRITRSMEAAEKMKNKGKPKKKKLITKPNCLDHALKNKNSSLLSKSIFIFIKYWPGVAELNLINKACKNETTKTKAKINMTKKFLASDELGNDFLNSKK